MKNVIVTKIPNCERRMRYLKRVHESVSIQYSIVYIVNLVTTKRNCHDKMSTVSIAIHWHQYFTCIASVLIRDANEPTNERTNKQANEQKAQI